MIRKFIPVQVVTHNKDFDLGKVEFNLNTHFNNKPCCALWTCDFQEKLEDIGWIEWNLREYAGWDINKAFIRRCLYTLIPKKKDFKIYEISGLEDLKDIPYIKIHDENFFDYDELKQEGYDGLHITWEGSALGHTFGPAVSSEVMLQMNGFDCESTVWFNTDWIEEVKCVDPDFKSTFAKLASVYD